jgi:hypothetical protein
MRYAKSDRLDSLMLATTKPGHGWNTKSMGGKPLEIVRVQVAF